MPLVVTLEYPVAIVALSNPGRKNAVDVAMRLEMQPALQRLEDDAQVRAIILTGEGEDFCAGADIKATTPPGVRDGIHKMRLLQRMVRGVAAVRKPVVAAVRGNCLGLGWSLALACDFVIAADDARFQFAFRNIGLAPDGGASFLLARQVGLSQAKALLYFGRALNGVEAHALGLATEVVAAVDILARARAMALALSEAPALALEMAKQQLDAAAGQTFDQALELEAAMQPLMLQTDDYAEGMAAFRDRRKPNFRGT